MANIVRSRHLLRVASSAIRVPGRPSSSLTFVPSSKRAVVVGIKDSEDKNQAEFASSESNEYCTNVGGLLDRIASSGPRLKEGAVRLIPSQSEGQDHVVIVGLGKSDQGLEESLREGHDLQREAVRKGVSNAVRSLKNSGVEEVLVDGCGDPEAAAEGAVLSLWAYDYLKAKKDPLRRQLKIKQLTSGDESHDKAFEMGYRKAKGQNFARTLMETPANYMTPKDFAKKAQTELSPLQVEVIPRDLKWIADQKMGSFLGVAKGSNVDPVFLEMSYNPGRSSSKPIIFVGKGVTFDTGGISLKPPKDMDKMRGDMGGAACVTGSLYTAASLRLPLNMKVLIPLCENMPSGKAVKPGDVVTAMNGNTIQVDNTDAEGRLILADALCYADKFEPQLILDAATLTGAMAVALGGSACGVYSTSESRFRDLQQASFRSGDRVWRMPLWNYYSEQMRESRLADLNNIGGKPYGGSCTAAAFLKEFVKCKDWMHLDIAGVMDNAGDVPYLPRGMAGRPTRTLVEFLQILSQKE